VFRRLALYRGIGGASGWGSDVTPQGLANRFAFFQKIANYDAAFSSSNDWLLLVAWQAGAGLPAAASPNPVIPAGWFNP